MPIELLCRKLGMTRIFDEAGRVRPVTVLEAEKNVVVQKKTPDRDGYHAVQLGFTERKPARTPKPLQGHFARAGVPPKRFLAESRLTEDEAGNYEVGQEIGVEIFETGQKVDVIGTSRGRGYTGVVKRHNFAVKRHTHGTHEFFRHGGSIGAGAFPGKVIKGLGMAGQYGNARVTTRNLEIAKVDPERNLLFVCGAVPGHKQGLVRVRPAVAPRR